MKTFPKQKKIKGFTLVETMVALSIFTVSLLSLIVVLASGIKDSGYAKRKIIATYLAQEGIEYTRNIRDTFVQYQGTTWVDFRDRLVASGCADVLGCYFDYSRDENDVPGYNMFNNINQPKPITKILIKGCTGTVQVNRTACPELLYQNDGTYSYTGDPTGFQRKIHVELYDGNDYEMKITSTVYWTEGPSVYNVSFSENLFDWQ